MDRGELVEVDLHEGLETTLTVLGHKLKHTSIAVVRDYDRSLPQMTVRGSELNQVWTNLLDNAIDALGERGTITIRTSLDASCAVVEIGDDGPGIPDDVRERIFDPFFTTKDVGLGTGLGLATARRIVVDRHDGSLAVESEPGSTTFRVRLPLTQTLTGDDAWPPAPTSTRLRSPSCPTRSTAATTASPTGGLWCHLRICLALRARRLLRRLARPPRAAHAAASGHPLIRSIQPGEDWSWCFVDETAMRIRGIHGEPRDPAVADGLPMSDFVSRGFGGRRRVIAGARAPACRPASTSSAASRSSPPGRRRASTPDEWSFRIDGMVGHARKWSGGRVRARCRSRHVPCDIHCVTKWSKLGTSFRGVSLDALLEEVEPLDAFAMAHSYGGYTTNLPLEDLTDGKAWVVTEHEGEPLAREHGGPARLLVPHLYFWKSAKWVAGLRDHRPRRARLLGGQRLPQPRRSRGRRSGIGTTDAGRAARARALADRDRDGDQASRRRA